MRGGWSLSTPATKNRPSRAHTRSLHSSGRQEGDSSRAHPVCSALPLHGLAGVCVDLIAASGTLSACDWSRSEGGLCPPQLHHGKGLFARRVPPPRSTHLHRERERGGALLIRRGLMCKNIMSVVLNVVDWKTMQRGFAAESPV